MYLPRLFDTTQCKITFKHPLLGLFIPSKLP